MGEQFQIEEFRKIQLTGKASYLVYLPKKWVAGQGLKQGDQLAIRTLGNSSLLLVPKSVLQETRVKEKKKANIAISSADDPQSIVRKVISSYLVGYTLIRVYSKENHIASAQRTTIKDTLRRKLTGAEIVSEDSNEIVMQILTSHPELTVEDAIRRMFIITSSMHRDAFAALKNLDKGLAQSVISVDDEVDRFHLHVVRQLKAAIQNYRLVEEIGIDNPREFLGYRLAINNVERIADLAVKIAKNILTMEKPVDDELYERIFKFHALANKLLGDSMTALLKRDYKLADNIVARCGETMFLEEEIADIILSQYLSPKEISSLRLILDSSARVLEYIESIAEVTLNRAIETIFQKTQ